MNKKLLFVALGLILLVVVAYFAGGGLVTKDLEKSPDTRLTDSEGGQDSSEQQDTLSAEVDAVADAYVAGTDTDAVAAEDSDAALTADDAGDYSQSLNDPNF